MRAADDRIFPARSGLIAYSQSWRSLSLPACTRNPWLRVTMLETNKRSDRHSTEEKIRTESEDWQLEDKRMRRLL